MFTKRVLFAGILGLSLVACTKDEVKNDDKDYSVPKTYNFENASYSGQISRLNMLAELSSYMKKVNANEAVMADQMKKMYANDGYTWTSTPFAQTQPTKQLKSKTFSGYQGELESWMDKLATISTSTTAGVSGTAGHVSSNDGSKKYLFDEKGFEPVQLIEKGIMGACFYFQGTSVYLSLDKLNGANNDKNEEGKNYTKMQHYWDEAFGYTAFPTDLTADNLSAQKDAGKLRFYSKYVAKNQGAGLTTLNDMMQAFAKGRAAIDNKDYNSRNAAIGMVQKNWEMINVAAALHYLNGSLNKIGDDALRNHQLSEAWAFINALKFNNAKSISDSEIDVVLNKLGDNFYEITPAKISDAKTTLAQKYGVNSPDNF
ncbi:MAG: DUF4856 domain-containing protein [Flavobacteriales bacterium]|jgi:hypothetical protein|nr:DUF4856 domain-containing protein [Flavobacteriales bacterium]